MQGDLRMKEEDLVLDERQTRSQGSWLHLGAYDTADMGVNPASFWLLLYASHSLYEHLPPYL